MNKPWLTVVMPVHRGGDWLDEALASVPSHSQVGEIAVVIRDSTPEGPCEAPLAEHRARLSIDYEYMPEIASWSRKTNLGVEAAQSEYVCTLHQDDLWEPDRARILHEMIAATPDAALYVTGASIIDQNSKNVGPWQPPLESGVQDPAQYRDRLLVQNSIAMPAPVWSREAYLAVGGLDEGLWYTPDWDLWLKLSYQGAVVFDPRPTACFRLHGSSLTMTGDKGEMATELADVLARHRFHDESFAPLGKASVKINTALAEASAGGKGALARALKAFVGLGPIGAARYLHYSRLFERVWPRLRLRMKGTM